MTRYLLSESIHVGDNTVPKMCCHILPICQTSVQHVWARVSGLAPTSASNFKAKSLLEKSTNDVMMTKYMWHESIHVMTRQCQERVAIYFPCALQT